MARKPRSSGPDEPSPEPQLQEPIADVGAKIAERIQKGQDLLPSRRNIATSEELKSRQQQMYTWNDYNHTLVRRLLGPGGENEYRNMVSFGGSSDPRAQIDELESDLSYYLRQLESIVERLALWEVAPQADRATTSIASLRASGGPIFIVHGTEMGRANEVARVLERATDREVVILHEQPNRGRTLLEKFEQHAVQASFAVVVLTADDEGRNRGTDVLTPRGRQNVVFEMGFFFALLGRDRVVVLRDSLVEQPSDVNGLVYQELDPGGAWKYALAREVQAAGIGVDVHKIH